MITADTNILVYAMDERDLDKQVTARSVLAALATLRAPLALQTLGELQSVLRRKLKMPPWVAAQIARNIYTAFDLFLPTLSAAEKAIDRAASGQLSYWDALIVASAREAGCKVLLSEDMQHGGVIEGVEIVNPFAFDGGLTPRVRDLLSIDHP